MQACLATGAYCMIDIKNFARWDGGIIGQGGPTGDQFASLWTQLATQYAASPKVVFELMNEPHDLDIDTWAQTCQRAVTAIRAAGATSQMILLPGTNFDSAATLASDGRGAALLAVANPNGTADGLLLDVHKYLDEDNSGTHADCVTNNTAAFAAVAAFLRQRGRQALVSETGASGAASCLTDFCAQNAFVNANSDVFVGLVAWAARSFPTSYLLSLTPSDDGGRLVHNALTAQCVVGTWLDAGDVAAAPPSSASSVTAPATTGGGVSTAGPPPASQATTVRISSSAAEISAAEAATGAQLTTASTAGGPSATMSTSGSKAGDGTSLPGATAPSGGSSSAPSQPVSGSWAAYLAAPMGPAYVWLLGLGVICWAPCLI